MKRERVLRVFNKIETGSAISAVILFILSISLCAGFKIDPIEDLFKLSNPKEIIVFISEMLTVTFILVAFAAPVIRYYWFRRRKAMNEP